MTDLCDIHGLVLGSPHHPQTSGKQGNVGNTLTALLKYDIKTRELDKVNSPATACFSSLEGMVTSSWSLLPLLSR